MGYVPWHTMSSAPLLQLKNLRRAFYGLDVLRGVDLAVAPGGITGLIGPNGAGKTTLFNVVSGLVPPDGGSVRFDGEETAGWAADAISRRGLVRTFQVARGFPKLSVFQHLMLYGRDQPGENVDATAGRKADHHSNRPRREGLRARSPDDEGCGDGAEHELAPCRRSGGHGHSTCVTSPDPGALDFL